MLTLWKLLLKAQQNLKYSLENIFGLWKEAHRMCHVDKLVVVSLALMGKQIHLEQILCILAQIKTNSFQWKVVLFNYQCIYMQISDSLECSPLCSAPALLRDPSLQTWSLCPLSETGGMRETQWQPSIKGTASQADVHLFPATPKYWFTAVTHPAFSNLDAYVTWICNLTLSWE